MELYLTIYIVVISLKAGSYIVLTRVIAEFLVLGSTATRDQTL